MRTGLRKITSLKKYSKWIAGLILLIYTLSGCSAETTITNADDSYNASGYSTSLEEIQTEVLSSQLAQYTDEAYEVINENIPYFEESDYTTTSFESYSDLDELGRCGVAYANIGQDLMPTEERGAIGSVKPSGWHTVKYDIVDGNYLYNRCHLIGYQLTGENANEKNLITGTRYLNIEGMQPFENMVADYIEETGNHVLYRVTPVYEDDDLVASGVLMEGYSVEDEGAGICYNVYCYNVQPGIEIDYATGDSWLSENSEITIQSEESSTEQEYILNTNTKKFHDPDCSSVDDMNEENKEYYTGNRADLIAEGYDPCGNCKP